MLPYDHLVKVRKHTTFDDAMLWEERAACFE